MKIDLVSLYRLYICMDGIDVTNRLVEIDRLCSPADGKQQT